MEVRTGKMSRSCWRLCKARFGKVSSTKIAGARIDLIDGPASLNGSVAQRLAEEANARTLAIAAETQARVQAIQAETAARDGIVTAQAAARIASDKRAGQ